MIKLIDLAFQYSRTVLMLLALILITGFLSYLNIPKESNPDITVPFVYVSIHYESISPEDADRLLVKPMEKELRSIDGLKELKSTASEGHASIFLEFVTDVDIDIALQDVREKVDTAKAELPNDADEPIVREVNLALFPVLVVTLSGHVDERILFNTAKILQDKLETLPGVLEAKIKGDREELAEIIIDPVLLESYNISQEELFNLVSRNNQLVAAGTLDTGSGRFAVKVPGLFETEEDILNLPVKVDADRIVLFRDIAYGQRTYKDARTFARIGGKPAVTLEISKRIGYNIIETIEDVKQVVNDANFVWKNDPESPLKNIEVNYTQDESRYIRTALSDLTNNIVTAILLVMIVLIATLGLRSANLVGLAIPGSFLASILFLSLLGFTLNIVVLFSLILSVGMLVDGAIVVTEYAERKMTEGVHRNAAYAEASKRMAWPITASTATTLAVFMPLLFWPDITGEFMKYMPITILLTLSASLVMALIVVPTIGSLIGKPGEHSKQTQAALAAAETGDIHSLGGFTGFYINILNKLILRPWQVLLAALIILVGVWVIYGKFGQGTEFFPEIDPDVVSINVRARGDLSLKERDQLVAKVEKKLLRMTELKTVYTQTLTEPPRDSADDTIGIIQVELVDWQQRRQADAIIQDIRKETENIAGIIIETEKKQGGPTQGEDIQLELTSNNPELLLKSTAIVRNALEELPGLRDLQDNRPLPGIEWQIDIDRAQASRFGADISSIGSIVRLVTTGLQLGEYRPDDASDEIDIRIRFPYDSRNIDQLDNLRISINNELVPITNFVDRFPNPKLGKIHRVNGKRTYEIKANVNTQEGYKVDQMTQQIKTTIKQLNLPAAIEPKFRGNQEKQQEAGNFLFNAFGIALFVMMIILVTQFNSFYQALLILSAVVFSTTGVAIGLLVTGQPFGIVMSGVGVIALAGVVVNNNIVLIDTFNYLRKNGMQTVEAALRTGAQRLRPVLLTTITTILGLLPMVYQLNIDFIQRDITIGAPSSQWWNQLSTAIAGGLAFATLLTLILTPCLLVLKYRKHDKNITTNTA